MKRTPRTCDGCTMCCKLLGVAELNKPSGSWCGHCDIGQGCKIYEERPETCRDFHCLWVRGNLPEALKPSRTKAVFWIANASERTIQLHVDVGRAWRGTILEKTVETMVKDGWHVCILQGGKRTLIKGDGLPLPKVVQEALP